MSNAAFEQAVVEASTTGDDGTTTIACPRALSLAKQHAVAPSEVGRVCNEKDIRIVNCQLGCFK